MAPAQELPRGCEGGVVRCDVGSIDSPDAATVDLLARLQLTAKRFGVHVRLVHASRELKELLDLAGLTEVVPCDDLSVEARRQTEEGEHPGRVEEEADPGDLSI